MKSETSFCLGMGLALSLAACSPDAAIPSDTEMADHSEHQDDDHAGHDMAPSAEEAAEKQTHTDKLVERFGVEQCGEAETLATMRKTDPDGSATVLRAYQAATPCATDLKTAAETLEFNETEAGLYSIGTGESASERLLIEMADDGSGAVIEWEVDEK